MLESVCHIGVSKWKQYKMKSKFELKNISVHWRLFWFQHPAHLICSSLLLLNLPGGWKKLLNTSRSQAKPPPGCIFFTTQKIHRPGHSKGSQFFPRPSQGPKRPLRGLSRLQPWRWSVALLSSVNNIRCTDCGVDGQQGFNLKAKSQRWVTGVGFSHKTVSCSQLGLTGIEV